MKRGRQPKSVLAEAWETLIGSYRADLGGALERRQLDDVFHALSADAGGVDARAVQRAYRFLRRLLGDRRVVWLHPHEDETVHRPIPRLTPPGSIARALPPRRFAPFASPLPEPGPSPVPLCGPPPLFGRYLLGEGFITLSELTAAISWQRAQRPAVGEIAVDWRILTHDQVSGLLDHKPQTELFCDFAVSRGLMTSFHRMAVLAKQRRMQRPIGTYFVENGILTQEQVDALARRVAR